MLWGLKMNIEIYYDEETQRLLKYYNNHLTEYTSRLLELLNEGNYSYSERVALYNENSGRIKLQRIITNLENRIPKSVIIVDKDIL